MWYLEETVILYTHSRFENLNKKSSTNLPGNRLKRNQNLENLIKICKSWLKYVNSDLNAAKTELNFSMCKSVNFDPNNTKKYFNNVKFTKKRWMATKICKISNQKLHSRTLS